MNLINKISHKINGIILAIKSLHKVYSYGGFSSINITPINHGEVLKGKNILITGGSSGIGYSIARKCLDEGANVIITGRNEKKLKEAESLLNNKCLKILTWDISKISQANESLEIAEKLFEGDIDILVNNAGILNDTKFPNVSEEAWDNVYATNSKGLFFTTQALCDKWIKRKNLGLKKIINISSQGGFVGATYPYRMTKWDVAGLTQGLGITLAPYGIIVNGIAPGVIVTNMQSNCQDQKENVFYPHNPIQRFAIPEEIAELTVFLLSDAANFIVGQTIICDGGYSLK